jgi:hypothetical protein
VKNYLYSAVAVALICTVSSAADAREFKKIKKNESVGAQTMGPGESKLVNKGKINGGSEAGITATGSGSKTIVNNGTISGSTGIKVTGGGSVKIVNKGGIIGGVSITGGP